MRAALILAGVVALVAALWTFAGRDGGIPRAAAEVALEEAAPRGAVDLAAPGSGTGGVAPPGSGRRAESRTAQELETAEGGDRGTIRVLSRNAFEERLRALGIHDTAGVLERARKRPPGRGALLAIVTDEESQPVADARLRVAPAAAKQARDGRTKVRPVEQRSGSNGLALFPDLAPATYRLTAEHPDFLAQYLARLGVAADDDTFVEVRLRSSGAWIHGLVTDTSLQPLPGALVTARRRSEGALPIYAHATSDLVGEFRLRVEPETQSEVRAEKQGYHDAQLNHVAAGAADVQLLLEPADTARVEGTVVDATNAEPLAAFFVDGEPFLGTRGRFQVERNVGKARQALTVSADGYQARTVRFRLDENGLDLGTLELWPEASLSGIVLAEEEDGTRTVADASVQVVPSRGDARSVRTGPDGVFVFDRIAASQVVLDVSAGGYAPYSEALELAGEGATHVEVLLQAGTFAASGRVVRATEDGAEGQEPIADVTIEVVGQTGASTTTDADGRYRLTGIAADTFTLRASKTRWRDELSGTLNAVEGEDTTWDVGLHPAGLGVRFRWRGQAAPAGVRTLLWKGIEPTLGAALAAQASLADHRLEALTDAEGSVSFEVEAGRWWLHVPDYRLDPRPVDVDPESAEWLEVDLPGRTELVGTVRNADGSPVANTSIWLHSGDQDYPTMFLYPTDAGGRFSMPQLAPRLYALSVIKSAADQSAQHVREVQVGGAFTETFDIDFPPLTASIRGRLVDEAGVGKPDTWIGVEYLDAPHRSILAGWVGTEADGSFHVPRLEAGRHRVRTAWTQDEAVFSDVLVLAEGEEREIELVAPRVTGRRVRGHVLAADGGPLGPTFLFATDEEGRQNGNFFSEMDWAYVGAFELAGLRPGPYRIDVTAMACRKTDLSVNALGDVDGVLAVMQRE